MRTVLKRIVSCLMVVFLTIIVLGKATDVLQRKSSDYKYIPFFEHSNDFDVLFMGTSHMINAVFPMELWKDYGITSYNFGGHDNQVATSYWVMKNALDYSKPKVVVIDCLALAISQKTSDKFSTVHLSLDAFPISKTKIEAVNDLLNDEAIDQKISDGKIVESEKRTRLGLLWDYSVYHTRWAERLGKDEFEQTSTLEYGAESRIQITQPDEIIENSGNVVVNETIGIQYLKRMIEECKRNDIEVLLVYLPFPVGEVQAEKWSEANYLYDLAEEYSVNYINFLDENIVDFETDCYDPNSHLNPSGAWKVTDYLGQYLVDRYDIVDYRNDSKYAYWNDDYLEYLQYKDDRLKTTDDLNTYLMLLEDECYGYIIKVGDNSIFQDRITMKLLKSKGIDISQICDNTKYIIVCGDNYKVINGDMNLNEKSFAGIMFRYVDDRKCVGYRDNKEIFRFDEGVETVGEGVEISVFDINKNSYVDRSVFEIEKNLGIEERYPNENGVVIMTSKALRKK